MYTVLIAALLLIAATLAGVILPPKFEKPAAETNPAQAYFCCDTGDGANCHPRNEVSFSFTNYLKGGKTDTYALLKSNVHMLDYGELGLFKEHLDPALGPNRNQYVYANGLEPHQRVFVNPSDVLDREVFPECTADRWGRNNTGYDRLYGAPDTRNTAPYVNNGCYGINDDLLLYLCRSDSTADCNISLYTGNDPREQKQRNPLVRSQDVKFDVYIRTSRSEGVPSVLANCYKPPIAPPEEKIQFRPSPGGQPNLQLRTFKFFINPIQAMWVSPFCKPAIYLYPEQKTEVNVSVFPQGKMLLTIPPYPKDGWDVVADPDGTIHSGSHTYDYLYYEASLPDSLISPPKEGFVMSYEERALFLTDLVSKLGLNEKETKQFVDYWVPILPKSPYYFIGVVPQTTLHELSPLFITPQPKHLIRVTLYFKPLDKKVTVRPPLILPVSRDGFTAVEWGGIFKQDTSHPFSCFM